MITNNEFSMLCDELKYLRTENASLRAQDDYTANLEREVGRLKAEAAVMRAALEGLGFSVYDDDGDGYHGSYSCPVCHSNKKYGHSKRCPITKALSITAGADLLKRLEKAGAVVEAVREASGCLEGCGACRKVLSRALAAYDDAANGS